METMSDTEFFDFFFGVPNKNNNNSNSLGGPASSPIYSSSVSEPGSYGFIEPGEVLDQDFECSSTSSLNNSPIRHFHHQNRNKPQRITVIACIDFVNCTTVGKNLCTNN